MSKHVSGIYVIVNTKNGKVYVGQAVDFKGRKNEHWRSLNNNTHKNRHLQAAWNKYGSKVFKFKTLEYCDIDQLDIREQHHIDIYKLRGMAYNIAGDVRVPNRGIVTSPETRRKLSEANKRHFANTPEGDEARRKLSESLKRHYAERKQAANSENEVQP
jgi:group I intron endonuclease